MPEYNQYYRKVRNVLTELIQFVCLLLFTAVPKSFYLIFHTGTGSILQNEMFSVLVYHLA